MIKRFYQSLWEKVKKELSSLNLNKLEQIIFYSLILLLPTQLGLHFWPDFSYVLGVRVDYLSPTLYLTDILIVFLFLISFVKGKIKLKINIYFAFFLSLLILSSILAKNYQVAFYGLLKILEFSFLAFYTYKYSGINSLFIKLLSVSLIFESLLGAAQFLNKASIGGPFYLLGERTFNPQTPNIANTVVNGELILRPYGTFPHPNVLAAFLLIGICLIFLYAKPKNQIDNFFYYSTFLLSIIALGLTLSRVAILCAGILFTFKLFGSFTYKSNKKFQYILPVILLAIIVLPFASRFTNLNFSDEAVLQRRDLVIASVGMINDHPFFGVGLNNFLVELPSHYHSNKTFYLQPVHNIYLLAFSQLGIIAGFMFVIFLIHALKNTSVQMKIVLILVLFLGFFDHYFLTLQQGQLILSIIIGFSFSKQKRFNLVK